MKTKQYDEAVKEFKKALDRNGELFEAVYMLGMTYREMGDKKNAKEWLQRYVQNAGSKGSPEFSKAASDAIYGLDAL
jgi:lipopolysaccharide biosynthesis regulator YciM